MEWFHLEDNFLLLFFFMATGIGWLLGRFQDKQSQPSSSPVNGRRSPSIFPAIVEKTTDVFIKMLEASPESIESHIALGNLFKSKGDLGKAIEIHQNAIGREGGTLAQRSTARLALAQDFLSAGLFDRAETLFLDLHKSGEYQELCLEFLAGLYEREHDWVRAIETVQHLNLHNGQPGASVVAHYFCELAQKALSMNQVELARQHLENAHKQDKKCARSTLLLAEIEIKHGNHEAALSAYLQTSEQESALIPDILQPLKICYQKINDLEGWGKFLKKCLKESKKIPIILAFTETIREKEGSKEAIKFMLSELRMHPSLIGLYHLIGYYVESKPVKAKEDALILQDFIGKLAEAKSHYQCHFCGFTGKILYWQCPNCKRWGTTFSYWEEQGEI
ncbi:MAG: lipopolysaccharide assembly protein LapB [Gammaproteobacteria bacterium]|nr:lipopolysaccharide assembly protein LapB [Gammaproteobacteria bacterium]